MKILFISELFWPYLGGAERLGARLAADLQRQGHELLVITSHDQLSLPDEESYCGIPIHRFAFRPALKSGNPGAVLALRKQLKSLIDGFAPDLIHLYQLGVSCFIQLETLCNHSAPLAVSLHNDLYPSQLREKNTLFLRLFHAAAWITSCSQSALDQMLELDPVLKNKSSLIHNGFELPEITPAPYPEESMRLLCLGRLVDDKGFDIALRALVKISARFPGVRMTIAGYGPDRAKLETLAAELGLDGVVDFAGIVAPDQVPALLGQSNIVLMPSRREGLPVVTLEAACAARPVIASRAGGLEEIVVDNETGILIEQDDVDRLAESTIGLLEQPTVAAQLGLAARQRVQDRFSWQGYVDAHLALYRHLVRIPRDTGRAQVPV
jgi:glycogen(starch) synthase